VRSTVERCGRLDVLINNVGDLVRRCPIAASTEELFDAVVNLNVRSVVTTCRATIPHFREQGSGNIINTTSISARNGGGPGSVLYASSKAFVSTFTRGLAKELAKENIRVNGVAPGVIVTPLQARHTSAPQMEAFRASVPMGRLGSAEECTGAYLYLASTLERLRHRPDSRSQRWPVDAVNVWGPRRSRDLHERPRWSSASITRSAQYHRRGGSRGRAALPTASPAQMAPAGSRRIR
jgi:NAD(P)-dependent dehydrogenase (short-subunit alcohol dehydrogenase family)